MDGNGWMPLVEIAGATARLGALSGRLAEIASAKAPEGEWHPDAGRFLAAGRLLSEHERLWFDVVPESVLLAAQRRDRPMPTEIDALASSGPEWEPMAEVLAALAIATRRLATGTAWADGVPFARVCSLVIDDLSRLIGQTVTGHPITADDRLDVFGFAE